MAETLALKRLRSYTVSGSTVELQVEAGPAGEALVAVTLAVYEGGLVRYRLFPREPVHELVEPAALVAAKGFEVKEEAGRLLLTGAGVRVVLGRDPWRVEVFAEGEARPRIAELPDDVDAHEDPISTPTAYRLAGGRPSSARVNLALDAEERFYGLGEKHTRLERRGQKVVCWNVNPYGAGRETAYKNIPLLLASRGTGLFLNETCRSTWDVGASSNFSLSIDVDGPGFDLFVLVGRGMKDVLARYADLTGHASLPPRWSFGLWISPYGEQRMSPTGMNQQELLELADSIREHGIPCDVIHLDPYWMGDEHLCHFEWDRSHYPDPPALVRTLGEKGFRVCLWEHPYLAKGGSIYDEAAARGFLLKRGDGSVYDAHLGYVPPSKRAEYTEHFYSLAGIVDFSNPEAVEWYKGKHRPHLEMGVATFKSDFGEMIPEDAVFANGLTGREMHNLFPLLYNRAVFEVIGERHERPVVWGRSGYAGSQRYPVQWSGDPLSDFKSLAATIRAGLSYGLSGVPFWTFDLGGFKGQPTTAAYVRWAQAGLLLSHSRFHGTTPRLAWHYGEEALAIVRDFVKLRYRLLPYIYSLAALAVREGLPVMRPLALERPDDPAAAASDLQFLLGPHLLVAPVLNEAGEVTVSIPSGGWSEYFGGERVEGPRVISRTCGLSEMPLYVSEAAILPFCGDERTVSELWDPLGFEIHRAASGSVEIPEEGGRAPTRLSTATEGSRRVIRATGPEREWRLLVKGRRPRKKADLESSAVCTSRYDSASQALSIEIGRCASFEVSVPI